MLRSVNEEIEIFEEPQETKIHEDRGENENLSMPFARWLHDSSDQEIGDQNEYGGARQNLESKPLGRQQCGPVKAVAIP